MKKVFMSSAVLAGILLTGAAWAGPKTVAGPGADAACFKPANDKIKYFQWDKKPGPYRIAVVNGFVGNTWRIQMVKSAKAFAAQPGIKDKIKQLKVVSTGTDAAAQLGAMEDFINQGFDALVVNAVSPEGFDRIIRLADQRNVVVIPFDNVLDTDKVVQINEDQYAMGQMAAQWLLDQIGKKDGKILEVRGLAGNSVDRDRSNAFHEVIEKGGKFEVVQVVGNWDEGTSQKATADAVAVHKQFDGVYTQGGSAGVVHALMDAKHPFVPVVGEGENGFRKLVAAHSGEGLKGLSVAQSPALVSIGIKAAIAALEGSALPQLIAVPIPNANYQTLQDGVNYWSKLDDNFFAANDYPPCGVTLTAPEIMDNSEKNQ